MQGHRSPSGEKKSSTKTINSYVSFNEDLKGKMDS